MTTMMFGLMILFLNLLLLQLQMAAVAASESESVDPVLIYRTDIMNHLDTCSITSCGDFDVPYPFGIGPNCHFNHFFDVTCKNSSDTPIPILTALGIAMDDILVFYDSQEIHIPSIPQKICINESSGNSLIQAFAPLTGLRERSGDSPFRLRPYRSILAVEGRCGVGAAITSEDGRVVTGCAPVCDGAGSSICRAPVPYLAGAVESYRYGVVDEGGGDGEGVCVMVGVGNSEDDPSDYDHGFPNEATLLWSNKGLKKSKHVNCISDDAFGIESCACSSGYHGNPYLPNGCQVPKECARSKGRCIPYLHYYDNGTVDVEYRAQSKPFLSSRAASGIGGGVGALVAVLIGCLVYGKVKRTKAKRTRAKNFKRNGGMLLKQHTSKDRGFLEKTVIFRSKGLEKATDNFNKNRILGHGGQGNVYKGMLADTRVVAIKKAKKVKGNQCQQFINEVVILSQINHRNVVKLLGCCLEADVPWLVYEYVPNGMLSKHLNEITWQMRLRIATEIAGALAYLHSSSSTPIYHRDIKSDNILLDDKYRAKIADFGISRTVSIDQTHLSTNVVGTLGYLDPEYFRSNQFTDKSDVYSFGVVLVELLTGKRAIRAAQSGEKRSVVVEFLEVTGRSKLFDILDPRIVDEGEDEAVSVAEIATRCLNMVGNERPTMKEVATMLEGVRSQQPWSLVKVCEEIESGTSETIEFSQSYERRMRSSFSTTSFFAGV